MRWAATYETFKGCVRYTKILAITPEGKGLRRRRRRRGGCNIKMEYFGKEVISVWTGCVYSQIGTRGGLLCVAVMYHHVAWSKQISGRDE